MAISKEFQERFVDLCDEIPERQKIKRAEIIGISNTTFNNAYNYGIIPKTSSLVRIADYFNISVTYLLGKTDDEYFAKSANPVHFTKRLEELREEKEIKTIYELSQELLIHRNNIRQWYMLNCIPLLSDLESIANYFDVSIDYLLGRTDDRKG